MRRQLVRSRGLLIPVDLGQDHVRRVRLILQDIETHDSRLSQRCPRIDQRGSQEILHPARPDPHLNMDDQHSLILLRQARAA
jgi:hypothetical protein